jgi:hypothetical protein
MYIEAWSIPKSYDNMIISFFSGVLNPKAGLFPAKGTHSLAVVSVQCYIDIDSRRKQKEGAIVLG